MKKSLIIFGQSLEIPAIVAEQSSNARQPNVWLFGHPPEKTFDLEKVVFVFTMYLRSMHVSMYKKKSRIDAISILFGWRPHKGQMNKKESGNNGRSAL